MIKESKQQKKLAVVRKKIRKLIKKRNTERRIMEASSAALCSNLSGK